MPPYLGAQTCGERLEIVDIQKHQRILAQRDILLPGEQHDGTRGTRPRATTFECLHKGR